MITILLSECKREISLDLSLAVDDISRFVQDVKPLKIWSREYFMQLADRMKIIEA